MCNLKHLKNYFALVVFDYHFDRFYWINVVWFYKLFAQFMCKLKTCVVFIENIKKKEIKKEHRVNKSLSLSLENMSRRSNSLVIVGQFYNHNSSTIIFHVVSASFSVNNLGTR